MAHRRAGGNTITARKLLAQSAAITLVVREGIWIKFSARPVPFMVSVCVNLQIDPGKTGRVMGQTRTLVVFFVWDPPSPADLIRFREQVWLGREPGAI